MLKATEITGPTLVLKGRRLAVLLACLLAACTPAEMSAEKYGAPKEWRVFTTPGGNYHYVFPVLMEDGTRCIAMAGTGGSGGRSISCNWETSQIPAATSAAVSR
jgi:hypothetical protein